MADRTFELSPDQLHGVCDPDALGFETTAEVEPLRGVLGQDVAMAALEFGVSMDASGYHLFVLGRAGSGRRTFLRAALEARAAAEPAPPDWCYVYNFDDHRCPRALRLPTGEGPRFARDLSSLVEDVRRAVTQALESDDVTSRRRALLEERGKQASALMERFRRETEEDEHLALVGNMEGMIIVPARGGEALPQAAYESLPADLRKTVDQKVREAGKRLFEIQREIHRLQRGARAAVDELHGQVTRTLVDQRIEALAEGYPDLPDVGSHLERIGEDMVEHRDRFLPSPDGSGLEAVMGDAREDFFRRYGANPFVTHPPDGGAPIVEESNPHLRNLFGRMEGQMRLGVMVTDFTRIAPGSSHRANGGYLILDALEVLLRPLVWPALKRMLKDGELRVADPMAEVGFPVTESLEPEPIPARLKVVLVGEPELYYRLQALDSEFADLFKVKVDFTPHVDRTAEIERAYGSFVAAQCDANDLLPFEAGAVARIVEEGARSAGRKDKLTTRFRGVVDLVREAAQLARAQQRARVTATDVDAALAERDLRNNRPRRELMELIERGTLSFEPTGTAVGQIYGIGLLSLGEEAFGRPIRVMASAYMGSGGVVNIEREAQLAGPIHTKGFLVLSGYLGRIFAQDHPLVMAASLSFDQIYEEVEGDSASAAELYALLSAVSRVPIRQGIGITGAVNQEGRILPIGGVTQKVEGYFEACQRVGLTGDQGVIVPGSNVDNLTLRAEVRSAVAEGRFHLWAIDHVEEGWPILSGLEAGALDEEGGFAADSVYAAVAARLEEWAARWQEIQASGANGAPNGGEGGTSDPGEGDPANGGEDGIPDGGEDGIAYRGEGGV